MKIYTFFILSTLLLVHIDPSVFAADKVEPVRGSIDAIKAGIANRVDLLNAIIKDPASANMHNWSLFGNPHDETELSFYVNSISDGSLSAYEKNSITSQKLISHSQSNMQSEPSILLQHLRLSLMAFNIRPGASVPAIRVTRISRINDQGREFLVEGVFAAYSARGQQTQHKMKMIFEIDDSAITAQRDFSIALIKMTVGGYVVYGWWHDM